MGGGASCFRKGREGRRCCWPGGQGGPGMRATPLDWPVLEATAKEKKMLCYVH